MPVGRLSDRRDGHHRRVYISAYSNGLGYPYGYGPWIAPGYPTVLDYDDEGDSGSAPSQDYGVYPDQGYADNGGNQAWPGSSESPNGQYLGPWPSPPPSSAAPAGAQANAASLDQGIVLIFKDGRAPLRVHNYVLTQNSIFVGDARGITIALDQLDLTATAAANRDAGEDFQLPTSN
jgi:hypothetical protein